MPHISGPLAINDRRRPIYSGFNPGSLTSTEAAGFLLRFVSSPTPLLLRQLDFRFRSGQHSAELIRHLAIDLHDVSAFLVD